MFESPVTETLVFQEPWAHEGCPLEFRLVYEGQLPSSNARPKAEVKYKIRRTFHRQLSELWNVHPGLSKMRLAGQHWYEGFPSVGGFNFLPLVHERGGTCCSMDALFLRRETPGRLFFGGDIDNRVKTLFDCLKMPTHLEQMGLMATQGPAEDEKPFYCLVADDSLITSVSVTTDRLLEPMEDSADNHLMNNVKLVLHVKTIIVDPMAPFVAVHL